MRGMMRKHELKCVRQHGDRRSVCQYDRSTMTSKSAMKFTGDTAIGPGEVDTTADSLRLQHDISEEWRCADATGERQRAHGK